MADIELVIKIPNSTFTDLKKKQNRTEVDVAVLNGTPLSKGHGRLIDADELKKNAYSASAFTQVVDVSDIDNTPTVLEGTK